MKLSTLTLAATMISTIAVSGCKGVGASNQTEQRLSYGEWTQLGIAANGYRKAGAPVSLAYRQVVGLGPLAAVDMPLRFTSLAALDSMLISYSTSDGLSLSGTNSEVIASPVAGHEIVLSVPLVVNSQGSGTLNVFVTTVRSEGDEVFESIRAFAVPIGQTPAKKVQPAVDVGDDGKTYETTTL